jgi:thiamine biosynthesis lipoprotein
MGMPVTVQIVDTLENNIIFNKVFAYFTSVDRNFSTYKEDSETSLINSGKIKKSEYSKDMKAVLKLSEETKKQTKGFFDVNRNGQLDPLGLVKGWAILNASRMIKKKGIKNFFIEAGGDIQFSGKNKDGKPWKTGIRNPFNIQEIVKVVHLHDQGIATSGTYIRGKHVYNPKNNFCAADKIVSLTVIGPNVFEADRFATAAFAMGQEGINFIEKLNGFEGYSIDCKGIATMTTGFNQFTN